MGILLGALAAAASASLVPSGGVLMPIIGATESRERRRRLAQMQVAVSITMHTSVVPTAEAVSSVRLAFELASLLPSLPSPAAAAGGGGASNTCRVRFATEKASSASLRPVASMLAPATNAPPHDEKGSSGLPPSQQPWLPPC